MPYDHGNIWVPEWSEPTPHLLPEMQKLRSVWRMRNAADPEIEQAIRSIDRSKLNEALEEMGRDAARAQRDALFYWNALEEVKRGGLEPSSRFPYPVPFPEGIQRAADIGDGLSLSDVAPGYRNEQDVILDSNAGRVLTRLRMLGLQSASWSTDVGGPPAHTASRPYKRMIEWLLGKLADVGQFLLRIAALAGRLLFEVARAGAELEIKFLINLGLPLPHISLEIDDPRLVLDAEAWSHVTAFANGLASGYREALADG